MNIKLHLNFLLFWLKAPFWVADLGFKYKIGIAGVWVFSALTIMKRICLIGWGICPQVVISLGESYLVLILVSAFFFFYVFSMGNSMRVDVDSI